MNKVRLLFAFFIGTWLSITTLNAQAVWDGTVATEFAGGTGTEDDPYLISDGAELAYMGKLLRENGSQYKGAHFKLIDNILLNEDVLTDDLKLNEEKVDEFNKWLPIGQYNNTSDPTTGLNGYFDGNNFCISGIYCPDNYHNAGLFAYVRTGEVHNLTILDSYVKGSTYVGGLTGSHCAYNSGEKGEIYNCYVEACVEGGSYTGIAIGHLGGGYSYIRNCYTYGRVSGRYTGSIAGYTDRGHSENCYSVCLSGNNGTGRVFTGSASKLYHDATINSSANYSTGKTTEEMQSEVFAQLLGEPFIYAEGNYPYIEGLPMIGEDVDFSTTDFRLNRGALVSGKGSIRYYREFDGTDVIKAVSRAEAGETVYLKVTPYKRMLLTDGSLTVTNDETGETIGLTAVADNIWMFVMPESNVTVTAAFHRDPNLPLVWQGDVADSFAEGSGTQDDPYLISCGDELAYLAQLTNQDPSKTKGVYYKQTADIYLNADVLTDALELNGTPENTWTPIGTSNNRFQGIYDGCFHIISGMYINTTGYVGLFGYTSGATIKNVALIDAYAKAGFVGALVNSIGSSSVISHCYVEAVADGSTYSSTLVCGMDGDSNSIVEYCYTTGRTNNSCSRPAGLVSYQNTKCYIRNCFTTTRTTSAVNGINSSSNISNVYACSDYGPSFSSHATFCSKSASEMQTEDFAALLGPQFECDGNEFPYIPGLPKVGEKTASSAGQYLNVGLLENGKGSDIKFYREYTDGTLRQGIRYAEANKTVFLKLSIRKRMLMTEGSLMVTDDTTGEAITLTPVAENIWSFTMPENSVTATASFYPDPTVPPLWEGDIADTFTEGDGSEEDPIIIHDGNELAYLAQLTNSNADLTKGKYFELGADIVLNDDVLNNDLEPNGTPVNKWTPIGQDYNHCFQGYFDGKNHSISGLYLTGNSSSSQGLFGYLNAATVKNVTLLDTYSDAYYSSALAYYVGYQDSCMISHCYVEGNINSSYSGMIVGELCNKSVVEYCYTSGSTSGYYRAGLVLYQYGGTAVRNSFSAVKGAKAIYSVYNNDEINNVYSDEDLGSSFSTKEDFCSKHTIEMFTTDFAAQIGEPYVYVLGNYPYIPGFPKIGENRGWATPADPTLGGAGGVWDGETSIIFASGTGTEEDPYIINNGAQLSYLAKLTNANANLTKGRFYRLEADITLNEQILDNDMQPKEEKPVNQWEPIGQDYSHCFLGNFDGNNYTISGLYLTGSSSYYRGLFGYISGATVKNLSLMDTYSDAYYTAALVYYAGYQDSCMISHCFVEGNLKASYSSGMIVNELCNKSVVEYCYTSGTITSAYYRGGLVCYQNYGTTVRNSFSAVKDAKAFYSVGNSNNFTNVYFDSDLGGNTYSQRDDFRSAETTEMLTPDFATRMGEPYEYAYGYYPYIYGMPKIDKNGKAVIVNGYALRLGTVTNSGDCAIEFYRTYTKKTNVLEHPIVAGSKVQVDGTAKIYVKVTPSAAKRLSDEGLMVSSTGGALEVLPVSGVYNLFMFTMPQDVVTVSAKFVLGGYCGNPEVNNGRDMQWQLSDDKTTMTIAGTGEMTTGAWSGHAATVQNIILGESVSNLPEQAFSGFSATVDLRACTSLTALQGNVLGGLKDATVWLPATVTTIEADAFSGTYASVQHVYSPIDPERTLYANGRQVLDVNGWGDIAAFGVTANEAITLTRYAGYMVSRGTVAGEGSTLKFYADGSLTTEIPNGYKAIRESDATKVYVKALPGTTTILFKDGLQVNDGSNTLTVTQEGDDVFSFLMPASNVTISAQFTTGGYCGASAENNGHNLIWTLNDSTLAFQSNVMAQSSNMAMDNFAASAAPWQTLASEVKAIDFGPATTIGDNAFGSCTALVGLELAGTPVAIGTGAFAQSTILIVPAESYADYQASWAEYAGQIFMDKEPLTMKSGQQWRTYYSRVGRMLPADVKAYTIAGINGNMVETGAALDYIPANQAVLIEHRDKTEATVEAITTIDVCKNTTNESNLLQWLTKPMEVSVGQGYTLYKDEFVMVGSGTLPAGIAFLPAASGAASRLSILVSDDEATGIDTLVSDTDETETWYSLDGKKLEKRPTAKGFYIRNGHKVVVK